MRTSTAFCRLRPVAAIAISSSVPPVIKDGKPAWRNIADGDANSRQSAGSSTGGVVASDHKIRVGATDPPLPATRGQRGYAHRRVDVEVSLDGRLVVWDGSRELLVRDAPADPG